MKLRNKKKDKKLNTFHKYGKYTKKASRIKDVALEKVKEKQKDYRMTKKEEKNKN